LQAEVVKQQQLIEELQQVRQPQQMQQQLAAPMELSAAPALPAPQPDPSSPPQQQPQQPPPPSTPPPPGQQQPSLEVPPQPEQPAPSSPPPHPQLPPPAHSPPPKQSLDYRQAAGSAVAREYAVSISEAAGRAHDARGALQVGQKRYHASPARAVTDEQWAAAVAAMRELPVTDLDAQFDEVGVAAVVEGHVAHASRVSVAVGSKAEKMEATALGAAVSRAAVMPDMLEQLRLLVRVTRDRAGPPAAQRRRALF